MVNEFQLSKQPIIHFGIGKIRLLPELIIKQGDKIVLVTDQKSFMITPFAAKLLSSFNELGIHYDHIIVTGEPDPQLIDTSVSNLNDKEINMIVAIGGGSVIDAGKAISAMMYKSESVAEFLEGIGTKDHPGTKLPLLAMPTTSGTGSEATKNAVISQVGKNGFKKSLRNDNFVPDIAIIDPELTVSCPKDITAASGLDAFTQLTESFLSDKSNHYTDALAWEGLKKIRSSLIQSYLNGDDPEARTGMSFAALASGICLNNAGLGVVHGFASSIGGMFNIPHGIICGTLMAPANAINVRELTENNANPEALIKYVSLGKLFLGIEGKSDNYYIDGFLQYLKDLSDEMQMPKLNQFGIAEKDIDDICRKTEIKSNPVRLNPEVLMEIVSERL